MTVRDDRELRRETTVADRETLVRGFPTDRVRWGPILAGTFAALTALAVLGTLGTAIGLSSYDRGADNARSFAIAGGVWGVISMLIAFAFGGWLTARSAAVRGSRDGLLNGFMVAGVGIPLILFLLGSMGALMTNSEVADRRDGRDAQARGQFDGAVTASAQMGAANSSGTDRREEARRTGSRTAWSTLVALTLAIGAASMAGYLADARGRDDHFAAHPQRDRAN